MHVLFVCSGNTCRSPIAKALFEALSKEKGRNHTADSAGLYAVDGMCASDNASQVMREHFDLDLSMHKAKRVNAALAEKADIIICMTDAQCNELRARFPNIEAITLGEWASEPQNIADPYGGTLMEYLIAAKQIEALLKKVWIGFPGEIVI